MCKPMIADVVQEMIWRIVNQTGLTRKELGRFMEAWAAVRRLEAEEADREYWRDLGVGSPLSGGCAASSPQGEPTPESTPEGVEKVHPDRVEKVHEDEPEDAVQIGPETEKKLRDNAAAGKASLATRKKNALEKVEELRAAGVGVGKIADADKDLTVVAILDFLDRKPIPLPKLAAIERAVKKLEAEG